LLKKFEVTPSKLKMAKLPAGAKPLYNPVGTAPGVLLKHKGTMLIALPGVPREMQSIFENDVAILIQSYTKNLFTYKESLRVTGVVESEIAPLIDATMRENPHVYIKSHPKGAEPTPLIELFFTATSESEGLPKKRVEKAIKQISKKIIENGGAVELMDAQESGAFS
jgi:molybdopterin-biosynthesis enzyme MoeA-like protein